MAREKKAVALGAKYLIGNDANSGAWEMAMVLLESGGAWTPALVTLNATISALGAGAQWMREHRPQPAASGMPRASSPPPMLQ